MPFSGTRALDNHVAHALLLQMALLKLINIKYIKIINMVFRSAINNAKAAKTQGKLNVECNFSAS